MYMVLSYMILALIITYILLSWVPLYIKESSFYLPDHRNQKSHFHTSGSLHFYYTICYVHSCCIVAMNWSVAGCGWPSYSNINLMIRPSCTHMHNAPSSTSAADAATNFRMVYMVKIDPFSLITFLSFGIHPRKKWPHTLLLHF